MQHSKKVVNVYSRNGVRLVCRVVEEHLSFRTLIEERPDFTSPLWCDGPAQGAHFTSSKHADATIHVLRSRSHLVALHDDNGHGGVDTLTPHFVLCEIWKARMSDFTDIHRNGNIRVITGRLAAEVIRAVVRVVRST